MHWTRQRKHGDPLLGGGHVTPGTFQQGPEPTYVAMHIRVAKARGSAKLQDCILCSEPAQEWAYDGDDPDEVLGFSYGYWMSFSRDIEHYVPMCVRCHRRHDRDARRKCPNCGHQAP